MLPSNLVRVRYARSRLVPQYLDPSEETWRDIAEQLLDLFRTQIGNTRGELEEELETLIGNHPGQIVFQGLAKILEDRCEFEVVSGHPPERIRDKVFLAAAAQRTAGTFDREVVLTQVGNELSLPPEAVEQGLYADLKSEQRLIKFDDTTVTRLIERYNVALAQSILMRSVGMTATVRNETPARFRQLFRSIKFHRLMCEAVQTAPGTTTLTLDGPLSLFSATQKYGVQLANFLPTLLQCRDFDLRADVRWGAQKKEKVFVLTSSDGLVSHLPDYASYTPPELQMFIELFRKKAADWQIDEEAEVIPLGQGWSAPDFRLTHKATGRFIYLEVLGFWRRGGAESHLKRLRQHATAPFLLAVSDSLKIDDAELEGLPAEIHRFRQMPQPEEILRLANEMTPNLFAKQ